MFHGGQRDKYLIEIIDRDFLRVFSVEQLELVLAGKKLSSYFVRKLTKVSSKSNCIAGSVEVDLDDWQNWTEYKVGIVTRE